MIAAKFEGFVQHVETAAKDKLLTQFELEGLRNDYRSFSKSTGFLARVKNFGFKVSAEKRAESREALSSWMKAVGYSGLMSLIENKSFSVKGCSTSNVAGERVYDATSISVDGKKPWDGAVDSARGACLKKTIEISGSLAYSHGRSQKVNAQLRELTEGLGSASYYNGELICEIKYSANTTKKLEELGRRIDDYILRRGNK